MADWRLLHLHSIEAAYQTLRHKRLDNTRREHLDLDDARLAWIAEVDTGPKKVLASLHRYEIRLERSARQARQELDRRRVALVSTAPVERPKASPKASPSPKIISIETVERPPAPPISVPEPPPGAPPAIDLAPTTDN
jgi:hypothetical protein